jgi:hypothetical protein
MHQKQVKNCQQKKHKFKSISDSSSADGKLPEAKECFDSNHINQTSKLSLRTESQSFPLIFHDFEEKNWKILLFCWLMIMKCLLHSWDSMMID